MKQIKPVLIVMTSHSKKGETNQPTGFYLSEVTHPMAVLEKAGITVEFASIQGGLPPVDGLDLTDTINAQYWNSATFQQKLAATHPLDQVDSSQYSALFYAGGHGTMWDFPDSQAVHNITRQLYEQGGIISAVCHGSAALVNVTLSDGRYLISGKRISSFTDQEERAVGLDGIVPFLLASKLKEHGAIHEAADNWQTQVSVDQRIVTGQNPQSATKVGEAIRDLLL